MGLEAQLRGVAYPAVHLRRKLPCTSEQNIKTPIGPLMKQITRDPETRGYNPGPYFSSVMIGIRPKF